MAPTLNAAVCPTPFMAFTSVMKRRTAQLHLPFKHIVTLLEFICAIQKNSYVCMYVVGQAS